MQVCVHLDIGIHMQMDANMFTRAFAKHDSQGVGKFKHITYSCNIIVGFHGNDEWHGLPTEMGKGLYPGCQIILNVVFHCLL